jgi:hypothetical protein
MSGMGDAEWLSPYLCDYPNGAFWSAVAPPEGATNSVQAGITVEGPLIEIM